MDESPQHIEESPRARSGSWSDRLLGSNPSDLLLSARGLLLFNGICVASLSKGKSLTEPKLCLRLDEVEAELAERGPVERREEVEAFLQGVVFDKIQELLAPLRFETLMLRKTELELLQEFSSRLVSALGSLRVQQVQGLLRALPGEGRAALSASGLVVGRRYAYFRESISPKNVSTRLALLASHKGVTAPEVWKASQVLLLTPESGLSHLSGSDFERLGYELFPGRAVRVDIVERVINPSFAEKQPHHLPSLMHTFRCSEEEARLAARRLGLAGAKGRGESSKKSGSRGRPSSKSASGGKNASRGYSGGRKKRSRQ